MKEKVLTNCNFVFRGTFDGRKKKQKTKTKTSESVDATLFFFFFTLSRVPKPRTICFPKQILGYDKSCTIHTGGNDIDQNPNHLVIS